MEERFSLSVPAGGVTMRHVRFSLSHFCDGSAGLKESSFGFAVRGGTRIESDLGEFYFPEGSFFFLPAGLRYRSRWNGSPEIEYYMVHLSFPAEERYLPARLDALSCPDTLRRLASAEKELAGDRSRRLFALGELIGAFAPALSLLTPAPREKRNPAVQSAVDYIRAHFRENYSAAALSQAACVSESHLYHLFKKELQISPIEFRNEMRVEEAARLLREQDASLREILAATGFTSDVYFREVFKKIRGVTPGEYRRECRKTGP